ncbi:ArsO family NAD(P)H-dependent flavin-containing monooxygenase [Auraticoccus monumenti]|uniref:Predicted flavoprotein CzcO associated with the cation diffusion facilitator CzcD n=1 Tax=Auraticoccus monumenti TaxID=675864 RepID=A0A1G6ZNT9_9ACTN|nr:ArsO family NAD(P)H-dependent flavin-containing monooxygenase [Auraticoccus monumenti]SDE04053.1 Predicted flavoprotein CzcO associated with the cation diffusion facilitator CzcD [Auraticoccus monumenti]
MSPPLRPSYRVVVVGAGQAGLAVGFYLRRAGLEPGTDFVLLDAEQDPGGSWQHMWDSLTLFSPAGHSSLPGWTMPPWTVGFPPRDHVVDYLRRYEARYQLPVRRPVRVRAVTDAPGTDGFTLRTSHGTTTSRVVVSATGTWTRPFRPHHPGIEDFTGQQLHTVDYHEPAALARQRVLVVGGGNSAAQLLAEVSEVASTTWVTTAAPRFLPDDVDGRALFEVASRRARALSGGEPDPGGIAALGDIVVVPAVLRARSRGVLAARRPTHHFTADGITWADGGHERVDTVLWCTGFRPALSHLRPLRLPRDDGHPRTSGTRAVDRPGLFLLGYGDWTGPGSATLVGAARTARSTVGEILAALS